ncbi:oxidoreductase [Thiomicrorhabdus immobilis]|uniref:D-amino-acid oxidase n=1 Tax=Thiomicrorhabdus immobilis TaxID=2791037 RepID=A0ABN6CW47_9GAMM|nr:FAD-dependent oxidoreductase [Thiomicrorhabdus immobilis]BCN93307.1 oxidoreductase [Thiomicrorhabdus immobilis]
MLATKPKVAILGAGLLGRMLTVSLMQEFDVSLFDKDSGDAEHSAGYLAAAMLAPLAESADCSLEIMQMGEAALALWPEFLAQLDSKVYFQQAGSLIVAFEQDMAALTQFKSRLKGHGFETLNAMQINSLEPEITSRFAKGLYLPNEAQLDNRQLLEALAIQIRNNDVAWHCHADVEVNSDEVLINHQPLNDFDWIIDCRGFGLQKDLEAVSAVKSKLDKDAISFRGVRGEVVRVHAPAVTLNRPVRLMHPRYPIYIAPKENHHFVIGATQLESEDNRKPTVRSVLELLSACFSVHSGFAEAEIVSIDAGLRPAFLDNHPKIFQHKNRITVNGLFRHGYLLAPMMVKACLQLIKQVDKQADRQENCPTESGVTSNESQFVNPPGLVSFVNPYKKPYKNLNKAS